MTDHLNSNGSQAENGHPGKMDAALKAKWVEALRSGEYEQGMHVLRRRNAFCCLGVLCDLHNPSDWRDADVDGVHNYGDLEVRGFLPLPLRNGVGLTSEGESIVAAMNDDGKSFPEIADYIEKNL